MLFLLRCGADAVKWIRSDEATRNDTICICILIRGNVINHWDKVLKKGLEVLCMSLFHCAIIGGAANFRSTEIPPPPVHLSMCLFKKSPCHVAFNSLPALKHDVFRAHLQRAAAVPGTCYSPSSAPISHPLSHALHMSHACQGRKCCRSKCTATHI